MSGALSMAELVERSAGGDYEAFGQIYAMQMARIYRYVLCQVQDKMTAEDITEDVFLKAWEAIKYLRGRDKTLLVWLYRIAHNKVADHHRRNNCFQPM